MESRNRQTFGFNMVPDAFGNEHLNLDFHFHFANAPLANAICPPTIVRIIATSVWEERAAVDTQGLITGQARCLRHEVIPFRDARRPRSRKSVVFDGSFIISRLFQ